MNLKNIDCKSDRYNTTINSKTFNLAAECVESLYQNYLVDFDTREFAKVNIILHDSLLTKQELPLPPLKDLTKEERQQRMKNREYFHQNQIEKQLDVLTVHRSFNFEGWEKQEKIERKRQILVEIHDVMNTLSDVYAWNKEALNEAYYKSLLSDIENSWMVQRLKLKNSPNRKYKAGIIAEFDIDEFRFYAVIYSIGGTLIKKELIHNENEEDFTLAAESIIKGRTQWSDNEFILKNNQDEEIGKTIISESYIPYLRKVAL